MLEQTKMNATEGNPRLGNARVDYGAGSIREAGNVIEARDLTKVYGRGEGRVEALPGVSLGVGVSQSSRVEEVRYQREQATRLRNAAPFLRGTEPPNRPERTTMTIRTITRAARRLAAAAAPRARSATAPAGFPVGKALISAVALLTPIGAFAADWGPTHLHNPKWPPHAKFHNAQTMVSAILLPALSLWQLWGRGPDDRSGLRLGTLLAAAYYLTQAPAILFPGTAVVDPEFEDELPVVAGVRLNVLYGQAVLYPALAAAYALESRRLGRTGR